MTRSPSSELRSYATMQNSETSIGMEAMHEASRNGTNDFKQETADANGFNDISMHNDPNLFNAFMSPSHSSSSAFSSLPVGSMDKISSVVSMLKGTLESKKLSNQVEKEAVHNSSFGYCSAEEVLGHASLNQGQGSHACENRGTFQDASLESQKPEFYRLLKSWKVLGVL